MLNDKELIESKELDLLDNLDTRDIKDYWKKVLPQYSPRDSQIHVMDWINQLPAHVKYVMCEMPVGCHEKDTPIIMFNGVTEKVQNIQVGDLLMGPDGTSREVLSLHRGKQQMYEILPVEGDSFVVNEGHILSLHAGKEIINISVKDFLTKSNDFKKTVKLYKSGIINFADDSTKPLTLEPYSLGVLIGQGSISHNEFIPHEYKVSSVDDRLQILAGLINTDGYYGNNTYHYTTKSQQLANDVKFIVRSLGLCATSSIKDVNGDGCINVCISGDIDRIPAKLPKKHDTPSKQEKNPLVTGFTINKKEVDNYYGFTVDKDHLYLLGDFTVTHNSGKSPTAIAYSAYLNNGMGNAFILTPQKTLQKQYEQSFDDHLLASVYGRVNYTCEPKNTNCDVGSDVKPKCENCPAKIAREIAMSSPNMVLNYSIALTYFKYLSHKIKARDLMVFDECHTLESNLVEFNSIEISDRKCKQYGVKYSKPKNLEACLKWLESTYTKALNSKLSQLRSRVKEMDDRFDTKLSKSDIKILKNYKAALEHSEQLMDLLSLDRDLIERKYVLIIDDKHFKFKELFAKNNFKQLILPKANRFLFMSSTILDKEEFCNDLGINPDDAAMISVDSEFNVENREVIYKPITKMNYGWNSVDRTSDRKKMVKVINHIVNHHGDQSGIIHSGSFQVAEWLLQNVRTPHEVIHHNPTGDFTRDDVIQYYLDNAESRPILLISPSITEGMDLMGDKGRFAIIAKVPYPFLGDAWIKRRMQISKNWYNRQTITGIIQGCGRVVRSKEDWGQVYILDESFSYLYRETAHMIPKWWKDGLVVV